MFYTLYAKKCQFNFTGQQHKNYLPNALQNKTTSIINAEKYILSRKNHKSNTECVSPKG